MIAVFEILLIQTISLILKFDQSSALREPEQITLYMWFHVAQRCACFSKPKKTSKIKLFGKIVSSLITFFCGMFHLGCLVGFWLHPWSLLHSFIQQSQNIKQSQNNFCACANLANKVFEVCNAENLFHGPKHLCQSLFSNKVTGLRPAKLLKKRLWHKCFPVNFAKFLRTFFFYRAPPVDASKSQDSKKFPPQG